MIPWSLASMHPVRCGLVFTLQIPTVSVETAGGRGSSVIRIGSGFGAGGAAFTSGNCSFAQEIFSSRAGAWAADICSWIANRAAHPTTNALPPICAMLSTATVRLIVSFSPPLMITTARLLWH